MDDTDDLSLVDPAAVADLLSEGLGQHDRAEGNSPPSRVDPTLSDDESFRSIGPRIPGYRILREVGRGGMGRVFEAVQLSTDRAVAVKVMYEGPFSTEKGKQRFAREVRIAASLCHPNIARVYESGLYDGRYWYAMELVDGQPLDRFVESHDLSLEQRLSIIAAACEAVGYAHERSVVHRDLKPGNILVTAQGTPYVVDFGLAKIVDSNRSGQTTISLAGELLGTPAYMPPEQAGQVSFVASSRSDVYSLGVILYELLTGQPPSTVPGRFGVSTPATADTDPPPPSRRNNDVVPDVDAVVLKAIAKAPRHRYPSAGDMARDLRRYLAGRPVEATLPGRLDRLRKYVGRHSKIIIGFGAALTVLGLTVMLTRVFLGTAPAPHRPDTNLAVFVPVQTETLPASNWVAETILEGRFVAPSLAIGSGAQPGITVRDVTTNTLLFLQREPTRWRIEQIDFQGGTEGMGQWNSLKFGSDGIARVAYSSSTIEARCLKYAYRDDSKGWVKEFVNRGVDMGYHCSLALTRDNLPRISHMCFQGEHTKDLMYSWHDGSSWHTEQAYGKGWVGGNSSLALDRHEQPHIAHARNGDDGHDLLYSYRNANGWTTQTVDLDGDTGNGVRIGLDAEDRLRFLSLDATRGERLKYVGPTGVASWLGSQVRARPALALDDSGRPHVAYVDSASMQLRYAVLDGSEWRDVGIDRVSGPGATAIATGSHGPYIVYLQAGNNKPGSLKLAYRR